MVPVMSLWMPIILSAVIVFLASFVIHMVLTYHRGDYKAVGMMSLSNGPRYETDSDGEGSGSEQSAMALADERTPDPARDAQRPARTLKLKRFFRQLIIECEDHISARIHFHHRRAAPVLNPILQDRKRPRYKPLVRRINPHPQRRRALRSSLWHRAPLPHQRRSRHRSHP